MTALRIAPPTLDALDAHANAQGLDRSTVIRTALAEYLDRQGIEAATP